MNHFKKISLMMMLAMAVNVQAAPKKPNPNQAIYTQAIMAAQQKDYAKAFALLKPLADKGDATAQNNIAVLYEDGLGVPKSDENALIWYEKAAKKGLAEAQFITASMYADGRGTQQNYQKAFEWYQKAAKQGHVDAQNNLAVRYASGSGVKRNLVQAKYWFGQAAMRGHPTAAASLRALTTREKTGEIK